MANLRAAYISPCSARRREAVATAPQLGLLSDETGACASLATVAHASRRAAARTEHMGLPVELAVAKERGYAVTPEEEAQYAADYPAAAAGDAAALAELSALAPALRDALNTPFPVTKQMVAEYAENGFLICRGVLPPALVEVLGAAIREHTMGRDPLAGTPLAEKNTYNKAFIQVGGIWRHGGLAQLFSFSKRLAGIAAELMQTEGTLLHHDQALFKQPGGGFTPWHCDQQYWPLDAESEREACSAWVPLQAVPLEMAPLQFARGSHKGAHNEHHHMHISDDSVAAIWQHVKDRGLDVVVEPFELGDVSFHPGWCLHRADGNGTSQFRDAHTMQYVGSGMCWNDSFQGGKLGAGHAMDFLGVPQGSLREAGVPGLFHRAEGGQGRHKL